MITIKKHTEGDTRVAEGVPTIEDFNSANYDHVDDVKKLANQFSEMLNKQVRDHDWTKLREPYRSMFYRDLCDTIEGKMDFFDGKWSNLHYNELERHSEIIERDRKTVRGRRYSPASVQKDVRDEPVKARNGNSRNSEIIRTFKH